MHKNKNLCKNIVKVIEVNEEIIAITRSVKGGMFIAYSVKLEKRKKQF